MDGTSFLLSLWRLRYNDFDYLVEYVSDKEQMPNKSLRRTRYMKKPQIQILPSTSETPTICYVKYNIRRLWSYHASAWKLLTPTSGKWPCFWPMLIT
jgi:hypothetical protein